MNQAITNLQDVREPSRKELMREIVGLRKQQIEMMGDIARVLTKVEQDQTDVCQAYRNIEIIMENSSHFRFDALMDIKEEFREEYMEKFQRRYDESMAILQASVMVNIDSTDKKKVIENIEKYLNHKNIEIISELTNG